MSDDMMTVLADAADENARLRAELAAANAKIGGALEDAANLQMLAEKFKVENDALRGELAAEKASHEESNENYMQLLKEARAELAAERKHAEDADEAWTKLQIEHFAIRAELAARDALLREAYKVVCMSRMHDGLRHRMSALLERHDDE